MKRPAFFDTSIFLYADDKAAPKKQNQAIKLVSGHRTQGLAIVSLQVMQEYFVIATRKLGVDVELAQKKVEWMARLHVVRLVEEDVISAIELHRLHRISFWDAMIVHAARLGGAEVLYSEDLQDGASLAGVRIVNPFREAGSK